MDKILNILITIFSIILTVDHKIYGEEHIFKIRNTYMTHKRVEKTRSISIGLVLVDIPRYKNLQPANLIYNEILSFSKAEPFGDEHGRSTNVHETVHGINNYLRNEYKKLLKKNVNGFYAGAGKGIVVENPNLTIRDIIPNIPNAVRGYRYNLYFIKQLGDWNDVPTYPMDEWTSYIAGAECAVDDTNHSIRIPNSDYVSGALEFSIYCTALALTVKEKDINYWTNNEQFKNAIKYYLIKSEKVFFEGQEKFPSKKQDELLENLRNHNDAEKLRDFLLTEFEGIFVD
jgi:hypothetical protein